MKSKLMHLFFAMMAILSLGVSGATAGVLGKYNVTGSATYYGSKYGLWGTASVTSRTSCTMQLYFSDGDRASIRGKFKIPLKDTKKKQTVPCAWSGEGTTGSGSVTISGKRSAYSLKFNIKGAGFSGRGNGTK